MTLETAERPTTPAQRLVVTIVTANGEPVSDSNPLEVEAHLEVGDITIGGIFVVDPDTPGAKANVAVATAMLPGDVVLGVADPVVAARLPATLGQKAMVASLPVVIASDQGDVGVNVDKVAGTATATGAGIINAGTQRVVVATDQSALTVGGAAASGAAVSGNPVPIGVKAQTAPAAVTNGQIVYAMGDKVGRQVVQHSLRDMRGDQATTISASTAETTIVTADATYFLDLYGMVFANTGSSTTRVAIRDATAGTIRFYVMVPAGLTVGFTFPACDGRKQTAANNNWTAQCQTSTTALEVWALYTKNL